jgi:Fur family peroxide stress response transcriptional regulator
LYYLTEVSAGRIEPMSRRASKKGRTDVVQRLDRLQRACREREFRLTPQRRVLLETLVESVDHPSAEQLYSRVHRKLPGVSRATVFRILEQLAANRIIGKACHPGRSARYDVITEIHHHLVCLRCESMTDIFDDSLDKVALPDTTAHGFNTVDFRVQLRGYCRPCQQQMRTEES